MQLKSVKSVADVPFKGIEFIKVDGAITEVIIGGKLRIRKGESYQPRLDVLIETDGEHAKRYKVEATLEGFPPAIEFFEHSHEANTREEHFKELGATVTRAHVDVLLKDSGIIAETPAAAPADADFDAIPF